MMGFQLIVNVSVQGEETPTLEYVNDCAPWLLLSKSMISIRQPIYAYLGEKTQDQ